MRGKRLTTPPFRRSTACLLSTALGLSFVLALHGEEPVRRAKPPRWKELPRGVFFEDAFAEGLVGERPPDLGQPNTNSAVVSPDSGNHGDNETLAWSKVISPETIEDEIKGIQRRLSAELANAGSFKGQGYRVARRDLTTAAMLFAIITDYDGVVRWKNHAAAMRRATAAVALRSKVGSDDLYRDAQQLDFQLGDLVRGGSVSISSVAEVTTWPQTCERSALMLRLEVSGQEFLPTALASPAAFEQHRTDIVREAELVAAMAVVLSDEEMDDAADDEYREYCEQMRSAALSIVEAVKQDNYEQARKAASDVKNSCSVCHEIYRS